MKPKRAHDPSRQARLRLRSLLLSLLVSIACLLGTLHSPLLAARFVAADAPDGWLDEVENRPDPAIAKRSELGRVPVARPATGSGRAASHAWLAARIEPGLHAPAVALAIAHAPSNDRRPPALTPHELMVLLN